MNYLLEARKPLTLPLIKPKEKSWQCENMSGAFSYGEKKDKIPGKWRSVRPRKMVNIEPFEHEKRRLFYWI
jgi:hypothetical protein